MKLVNVPSNAELQPWTLVQRGKFLTEIIYHDKNIIRTWEFREPELAAMVIDAVEARTFVSDKASALTYFTSLVKGRLIRVTVLEEDGAPVDLTPEEDME